MVEKNIKVGIVGAGIQGVCNALFLQKKGFQVTLFDRDEPGNVASYGCLLYTSPSPRDRQKSRMPSSA